METRFVRVSTDLPIAAEAACAMATDWNTFTFVVWPLLRVDAPQEQLDAAMKDGLRPGLHVAGRLWFLQVIPAWKHDLTLVSSSPTELYTNEHSGPLKTWNHRLSFEPTGEDSCRYTDEIEIDDNLFGRISSPTVRLFFRYRQWRWRRHPEIRARRS